ncbi:MAG TPA: alpha/beta hydrolase [Acidimicrobiia bacterium]|nr:alpha/beta hydrolase [Acidimicrobiia bacterium]
MGVVKAAVVVGLVLALVLGTLWVFQRRLIYLPASEVPPIGSVLPSGEDVVLVTDDGLDLDAWFVPAPVPSGITAVVLNGNAGNRSDRAQLARALTERGFHVLLVDYRGYGGNPGSPTEAGLASDARAAVAYLEDRDGVDPDRIVYFGESLGAAVAIGLAAERPPAALVLRSPFTSLADVASAHYPVLPMSLLLWDRYENLERIPGIESPVLVIAGSDDRIVPISQSTRVFEAAIGTKDLYIVEGADHNDAVLTSGDDMMDAVATFVTEVVGGRSDVP